MGKAVQGSALYHACPADIQRTSVSYTVNLSVIMSSIMHRQQQEQQQRRQQNNPQKAKGHRLPWWRDSQRELCTERWRCYPDYMSITGLIFSSFFKQTFHWSPWESHVERRQDWALNVRQLSNLVFKIFFVCFVFCLLQIQIDRQTNPRAGFKNQLRHKINYFDITRIFPPNISHEIKKILKCN